MKRIAMIVFSLAALGASACGKKEEAKPTAGSGSAPVAGSADTGSGSAAAGSNAMAAGSNAAGSNAGSADATAEVDVPTEVDFEGEAAAKIDEKNLEAQLKAVEAELAR